MAITRAQQYRQMLKDGDVAIQGGVENHLGRQPEVQAPRKWQSSPDKPATELAYITEAEKNLILKADLHGGLENGPNMGPSGIMSLDSFGDIGGGGQSGADFDADPGGAGSFSGRSVSEMGGGRKADQEYDKRIANQKARLQIAERKQAKALGYDERENIAGSGNDTLDFINKKANYSEYTPSYIKFLGNLNRKPNRRYFVENVLRAGKIPGINTSMLDDENFDIEQAYKDYMSDRLSGNIDAMGNPLGGNYYDSSGQLVVTNTRDDGAGQKILPEDTIGDTEEEVINPRDYTGLAPRIMGSIFDFSGPQFAADGGIMRAGYMDGGRMRQMEMMQDEDDPTGGIMDLESGRQMYFLGKLVKKAGRAIKKVAKSPIGKAALLYFGGNALMSGGGGGLGSFFGKGSFNPLRMAAKATSDGPMTQLSPFGKILSKLGMATGEEGGKLTLGGNIGLGIGLPFALDMLGVGKDDDKKMDLDEYYKTQGIDIDAIRNNPNRILARRFMAEGGDAEPVAKKTMPLLDMDGMEKDYREEGGFVPIGRMERADDVPARLSKNEFVFTADAVRNAGEGDIDKGAEVMYNMMKNLESGGEVSEESQGLDGAREMFQTSKRLEEVL